MTYYFEEFGVTGVPSQQEAKSGWVLDAHKLLRVKTQWHNVSMLSAQNVSAKSLKTITLKPKP